MEKDTPIIAANSITLLLAFTLLFFKFSLKIKALQGFTVAMPFGT
jgi:uncharacterized protein with PQ loop repeat